MRMLRSAALWGIAAVLAASTPGAVRGQTIDPATFTGTMTVGQTIVIDKTITLGEFGANLVDLFFLADNTGSMGGIIDNAQIGALDIMGAVPAGADYQFGVGSYLGDPSEYGYDLTTAYTLGQDLTASTTDAQTAINNWVASGGADWPEANFYALEQVAGTTSWRVGSQRLVVWFGDAPSHTLTTTEAQAIAALQAEGITVIGFNSSGLTYGIDAYGGQASAITSATGGTLVNNFLGLTAEQFVTAVNSEISLATSTIDLLFGTTFTGTGLTLELVCTDLLGCDAVSGGESRDFQLRITANEVGSYEFETYASGIAAREYDFIRVVDGTSVPEPGTMVLLASGLIGFALVSRRRRFGEFLA